MERYYLINRTRKIGVEKPEDKEAPVVSLTSFPARIENVWITIETLLRQTRKPHTVVLWLSEKQFPNKRDDLPERLLSLEDRGLQIRFVSEDYRSHKKFYYAFSEYTDRDVITVDDDLFYPYDTVERLVELSKTNKNKVCCTVGHLITRNDDGTVMPYNKWIANPIGSEFGKDVCPIGIGGVLYPKGEYRLDMLKPDIFMDACKFADDLWLKLVCEKNGVDAVKYVAALSMERKNINMLSQAYDKKMILNKILRLTLPYAAIIIAEKLMYFIYYIRTGQSIDIVDELLSILRGGVGPGGYYIPIMIQFVFIFPIVYFVIKKYDFKGLMYIAIVNVLYEICIAAYKISAYSYKYIFLSIC